MSAVFLFTPVLGIAWYWSLNNAAAACYPHPPGTHWFYPAAMTLWMIPAGFLGLLTSAVPLTWVVR